MSLINVTGKPMLVGFFWDGTTGIIKVNSEEGNDNEINEVKEENVWTVILLRTDVSLVGIN